MATNHKQNKGIISELIALTYLSKLPDTLVFQAVCSVGPVDVVTFNTKTKEYINYDVKTVSYRQKNTHKNRKGARINRCTSKKQKDINVKILYVYEDGRIKV